MSSGDVPTDDPAAFTVLDHVDGIRVPGKVFEHPTNEFYALVRLMVGLHHLAGFAGQCDEAAHKRLGGERLKVMAYGNVDAIDPVKLAMLACVYEWYAVSACQYVGLVGAIACLHDASRPKPPAYIEAVLPDVKPYRDKVAAHYAWSKLNTRDNSAERFASIIPPIVFFGDSFRVGGLLLTKRESGKVTDSSEIQPWSIGAVHQRLGLRYWPDAPPSTGPPPP